jgi:hypothetical protein
VDRAADVGLEQRDKARPVIYGRQSPPGKTRQSPHELRAAARAAGSDDELSGPIIPIPELTTFVLPLLPQSFDLVTRCVLLNLTNVESGVDMHGRLIGVDDIALRCTLVKDERFDED